MNILFFQKGGIGDVVFGLPLLADLKRAYPRSHLTALSHGPGRQVLELCPYVDRALSYGPLAPRWSLSSARRALGDQHFDLALTPSRSLKAAFLLWRRAGTRVGFAGGLESWLFTHRAPVRPAELVFSRRFERLGAALGLPAPSPSPSEPAPLRVPLENQREARARLAALGWKTERPLVSVHVGGGWPTKRWPAAHVAQFCRSLNEVTGAQTLLQGGAADRPRALEIAARAPEIALVTAGNAVGEALAEAALCGAAVGVDSGLSHATAALGIPVIFLFGPNDPRSILLGPRQRLLTVDLSCRPCNRRGRARCPLQHHRCMRELTPGAVLDALRPWLELN